MEATIAFCGSKRYGQVAKCLRGGASFYFSFSISTNIEWADRCSVCCMQVPMYLIEHAGGWGRSFDIKNAYGATFKCNFSFQFEMLARKIK